MIAGRTETGWSGGLCEVIRCQNARYGITFAHWIFEPAGLWVWAESARVMKIEPHKSPLVRFVDGAKG